MTADPARGFILTAATAVDKKTVTLGQGVSAPVDTDMHRVNISSGADGRYTVTVDGREVIAATDTPVRSGNAFGIADANRRAEELVSRVGAVIVDDVVLRAAETDTTRLEAERRAARERVAAFLAGRRDELLDLVRDAFGLDGAKSLRNQALFNRAEENVAALLARLDAAATDAQRACIVRLLAELPGKQAEHVEEMVAIGQPAVRVPEFRRARDAAGQGLQKAMRAFDPETRETARTLVADLYTP